MTRRLLVVEDDPGLQSQMRWCFDNIEVFVAGNAKEAEVILRKKEPQVVTVDLGLPPDPGGSAEGFNLLQTINKLTPKVKSIVITGREEHENALRAIALGAYDFYQKPIDAETLRFVVERAFRLRKLEDENELLNEASFDDTLMPGLIGASEAMRALCRQVDRVAPTDATVMILGETGTGKEVIAENLHRASNRSSEALITINCAAIPENLLESELFGHEKGSFTGAVGRKIGKIEAADKGTLFLDEIGDMPIQLQSKILRFLQSRCIERIGSNSQISVDVRVISATHRQLNEMVQEKTFREDLFFRLSEICLDLPALRERDNDALLIANHLRSAYGAERSLRFGKPAVQAIENYPWPGNVRELENRIKRACIMSDGPEITPQDLELNTNNDHEMPLNLKEVRAKAEKDAIVRALSRSEQNVSEAARLLGVSRPTLYNLLTKHNVTADGGSEPAAPTSG